MLFDRSSPEIVAPVKSRSCDSSDSIFLRTTGLGPRLVHRGDELREEHRLVRERVAHRVDRADQRDAVVDEEEAVDEVELLGRGLVGDAPRVRAVELVQHAAPGGDRRPVLLDDRRQRAGGMHELRREVHRERADDLGVPPAPASPPRRPADRRPPRRASRSSAVGHSRDAGALGAIIIRHPSLSSQTCQHCRRASPDARALPTRRPSRIWSSSSNFWILPAAVSDRSPRTPTTPAP